MPYPAQHTMSSRESRQVCQGFPPGALPREWVDPDSLAERPLEGRQPGTAIRSMDTLLPAQHRSVSRPSDWLLLQSHSWLCWSCPKESFHLLLAKCPWPVTVGRQTLPSIWADQARCVAAGGLHLASHSEGAQQAGRLSYEVGDSHET